MTVCSQDVVCGGTALHGAAIYGHNEIIQWLIEQRADIDAQNEDGETALHRAVGQYHADCVASLIAAGARQDIMDVVSSGCFFCVAFI